MDIFIANVLGNIANIFFGLVGIVVVAGIIIRVCKDRFSMVREVSATVVDKQAYERRTYFISQAPFNEIKYVVTFLCGNKKLYFDVSEFSYNCYQVNQIGKLKYKGSKIIDFSEEN